MGNNVSISSCVNLHFRILILEMLRNQANSKMGLGEYVMIEIDFHKVLQIPHNDEIKYLNFGSNRN